MKRKNGAYVSRMLLGTSLAVSLAALQPAFAGFGFGGFTKSLTHPAGGISPALMEQQSKLLNDFAGSQEQILAAQELLAQAFGDKTQAAELKADGNALLQGASIKTLEKTLSDSSRASSLSDAQIQKGVVLTAQGRQLYLKALPHYAAGLARGVAMRPDFPNFLSNAENAVKSASIMEKLSVRNKLAEGMYVATHAPGYLSGVESTTSDLVTYAKKEKIAVPSNVLNAIPSSP